MSSSSKKKYQKSTDLHCSPQRKADHCMHALMSTAKMIHRYGECKLAEHPEFTKLSGPRIGVLFTVQAAGAIRMGDIAAKLMVAPRTVTDLIDGMERDGFLRRVADPSDRRAMLIELTPEIKTKFGKIEKLKKQFADDIYSILSSKEQDELIRLLEKLQQGKLSKLVQTFQSSD